MPLGLPGGCRRGLRRGSGGGGSTLLPPTLTPFLGGLPASLLAWPHPPMTVAVLSSKQTPLPQLDLCRACWPLNKGQPLLLIKISEDTLRGNH